MYPTGRKRRQVSSLPQYRQFDAVHRKPQQVISQGNAMPYGLGPGESRGGGGGRGGRRRQPGAPETPAMPAPGAGPMATVTTAQGQVAVPTGDPRNAYWRNVATGAIGGAGAYRAAERGQPLTGDQRAALGTMARHESQLAPVERQRVRMSMTAPRERIDARTGAAKSMDLRRVHRDTSGNMVRAWDPQLGMEWRPQAPADALAGLTHRREFLEEQERRRRRRRGQPATVAAGGDYPELFGRSNPFRS